jgi:hypothetical protein
MKITRDYHIYVFSMLVQNKTEAFDSFVARLRGQAENCSFENTEFEIKRQIIEKCRMDELRDRAFEVTLTLDELISTAKRIEAAENRRLGNRSIKNDLFCTRCGSNDHRHYSSQCKALRTRCQICDLIGHLSSFCFYVRPKQITFAESIKDTRKRSSSPNESKSDNKRQKPNSREKRKPKLHSLMDLKLQVHPDSNSTHRASKSEKTW